MAQQPSTPRVSQKAKPGLALVSIPDKLYFRIGEVARLCALPTYVLRFWESEFPQLKPHKGGTGQRLYRKRDVEQVMEIKRLLYDEKFTIAGARRTLAEKRRGSGNSSASKIASLPDSPVSSQPELPFRTPLQKTQAPRLQQLRGELREILGILDGKADGKIAGTLPERRGTLSSSRGTTSRQIARPSNQQAATASAEISTPLLF